MRATSATRPGPSRRRTRTRTFPATTACGSGVGSISDGTPLPVEAGNVRSADEASPVLASLRRGDVILLKASRSMGLEALVRRIVEEAAAGRWAGPSEAHTDGTGATKGSEA